MKFQIGLLAAASSLAIAGAASAADLPRRVPAAAPAPAYVAPLPVFTWTGFYVGVNAGAGFNTNSNNTYASTGLGTPPIFVPGSTTSTRFLGGGQAGYNWQAGSLVFGVETDIQGVAKGSQNVGAVSGGTPYAVVTNGTGPGWFGTARGRAGFAVDRALFYATGGLAYGGGGTNPSIAYTTGAGTTIFTPNNNGTKVGWTLGGGVEYAFTDHWSLKGEYDYVSLGKNGGSTYTAPGSAGSFTSSNSNDRFHVVRGGLNYKF